MDDLQRGNRGDFVDLMQRMLNASGRQSLNFAIRTDVDGRFGPRTETALRTFQTRYHLRGNGVCDRQSWDALGLSVEICHDHLQLLGQPSTTSCWATAAAMILGNMFPTVDPSHLGPSGGLKSEMEDVAAFAETLGWTMPNHSPDLREVLAWLARTPLWLAGTGDGFGHAMAVSGAFGDGTPERTLLRIHDPWPVGYGRIRFNMANDLHAVNTFGHRLPMSLRWVVVPSQQVPAPF